LTMSKPFVCTGCRVRQTLRPRANAGRDVGSQRRDFSRTARNDQTETYTKRFGQIQEDRERVRRQRVYEDGISQVGLGRKQPSTGGRYSGHPLRPQQLLQELDEAKRPTRNRLPYAQRITRQPSDEGVKYLDIQADSRSPIVKEFEARVAQSQLVEAWNTLRQMRAEMTNGTGPHFNMPVTKKLHQLMRNIVVYFAKHLESDKDLPTPWEFVQLVKDLGLLSPALRAELLWRLGNGLAMKFNVYADVDPAARTRAFQQIGLIWHDTLESKLVRESHPRGQSRNGSILPWSFLPSPQTITRNEKGSPRYLEDVLASIVPNGDYRGWSEAVVDYQSALFITLDLLKTNPDQSSTTTKANLFWRPMVAFFDDVLERVIKPNVPPAIQIKLEQSEDPALGYYEATVRRFDLANVPPIRTNRSKALRDMRRPKLDELGRPVAKRQTPTPPKKDVQAAKPKESEETSEPGGTTPALDRESLLKAGFSVSEARDMDPHVARNVANWIKRLGRSIETSNLLLTEACWEEVRKFSADQSGASSLPLFLYEHFMLAFLALRQPKYAVEAWNALGESGLRPTVRTWTVMMRGCSRANDIDTLEKFWARMKNQNVQPDGHAWSVRLFGLVKAKRINVAFSALQEMGQEWIAAVKVQQRAALPPTTGKHRGVANLPPIDLTQWTGDVGNVPRPDLIVVNSVISALATKSDEHIPRVLAWARDFAIEFDLTTYNALLNVAMRHGRMAEASSLIRHMETQKIQPNSTTITVVLTALFQSDYFADLPAEEQTNKLFALISSVESSSPTATLDAKGYALAIDRMLKEHKNPAAARALLEHMSARGFEPTAHIYTILMTSYFDADPPDFAAAEALWSRLQSSNAGYGVALDTIFYDRMVEAYARHHGHVGIAPMMEFLERMSREGKRPGWQVLEHVARALVNRGERGRLQGLVDDIRDSKGLLRVGVRGLVGQNEFWRYIIDTGILEREGVLNEQELRKNTGGSSFHGIV
jgi:pentatricopeptide repeat protein